MLRFFLVGFVLLYEALSDCAKKKKSSHVLLYLWDRVLATPAPTELWQFLLYILYLLGQFTRELYEE